MPTEETCSGWGVCWKWIFPYPCRKTWTCYCYNFEWVKLLKFGIFCRARGCELGIEYGWWEWCLGVGSTTVYNVRACYKSQRSVTGECGISPPEPTAQ